MTTKENADRLAQPHWFKSSHSGPEGGDCVEVAVALGAVHVRDSKDQGGGQLRFRTDDWTAFVSFARGR